MPIVILSPKGQMTIPKEVRKALKLKPSEKVTIVLEGEQAVIKPIRGTILDIGKTIPVSESEKPADFCKVREEVKKKVAKKAAGK